MVKVNDRVRFLNDVGGGRVSRIEGKTVYVEDEDGFERPTVASELVVVGQGEQPKPHDYERPIEVKSKLVEPDKPTLPPQPSAPTLSVEETPEGDTMNVVLAFEPREIKHLNTTTFYSNLVNDSNYYLYVTYMSRASDDDGWHTRYHGLVEPNLQITLDEFGHDDLPNLEHVAVQLIAFKQGKEFKLKNPALVTLKLNVTRFFKLHSFQPNEYFDNPVIALEIVHNDLPARQQIIDSSALERAMKQKRAADRPQARPAQRHERKKDNIIVQDLHLSELIDNTSGLSHSDMLNYQLDKFREVMRQNMSHPGQRIVFIHGKGEGVLRKAILDELHRKWPHCEAQDASFQEYGFGATQVTIHK